MASCAANRYAGDAAFDPTGLRILVVDDDPTCLKILDRMLKACLYEVTTCSRAVSALAMLREKKDGFDIVLSDVYMPDMDGFKLLEHIGLEMDLPVIMMSSDDGKDVVMKGVTHGACDYLIKPVRMEALKNIWQHVFRKKNNERRELEHSGSMDDIDKHLKPSDDLEYTSSTSEAGWRHSKKRKDDDEDCEDREDSSTLKKPRVVWSVELHQQFVAAVHQLGIEKAVPKKILELMNVPGLTRENVASHLQKYRLYLKRVSVATQHPVGVTSPFVGAAEMAFGSISSLDGFNFPTLPVSGQLSQQQLMLLQAELGRTTNGGIGISLADQMNFLNSDAQILNSQKVKFGRPNLSGNQVNLLHGAPAIIESKQLEILNQTMPPVRSMVPQLRDGKHSFLNLPNALPGIVSSPHPENVHNNSIVMQMNQNRLQFPSFQNQGQSHIQSQSQTQIGILKSPRPKGQLLNEITSAQSSGLPSPIGQEALPNEIASQALVRCGSFENVRDDSYAAASQALPIDLSKNDFSSASTAGLSSFSSSSLFQETLSMKGSLEGLDNPSMKVPQGFVPSFVNFNELPCSKLPYDPSTHINSIKTDPDLSSVVLGHRGFSSGQTNGQHGDLVVRKGMMQMRAENGNKNFQSISQHQDILRLNSSTGVKVENSPNENEIFMNSGDMLVPEQYCQDDLMSAVFKQGF